MPSNVNHSSSSGKDQPSNTSWIPGGFQTVIGPDNKEYIVPDFLFPALQQRFLATKEKIDLDAFSAPGTVHRDNSDNFVTVGEGKIMSPSVPGSSDRERLEAHGEILALQERLGISYKDAANRLYMAELERVMAEERTYKAFKLLEKETDNSLEMAFNEVKSVERADKK